MDEMNTRLYRLTESDYRAALRLMNRYRHTGARAWIETALLAVFAAGYVVDFAMGRGTRFSAFMILICLAVIGAIWAMPYFGIRAEAREQVHPGEIYAALTPDGISWTQGAQRDVFSFAEPITLRTTDTLLVLAQKNRLMIIPKNAWDDPAQAEAQIRAHIA